jgi:hypothetical protein
MTVHGLSLLGVAGIVSMLVLLGSCGGGEDLGDNAGSGSPTGAGHAVESAAVPPGPPDACPLTAAEVGEAVGVAVQQDATICMFEPQPGTEPRVLYVRQVSFACSDSVVKDPSFTLEPYDGLGVQAFASSEGGNLLVCTNPPFELTVDITPSLDAMVADGEAASAAARASERAAAEQLARLILGR